MLWSIRELNGDHCQFIATWFLRPTYYFINQIYFLLNVMYFRFIHTLFYTVYIYIYMKFYMRYVNWHNLTQLQIAYIIQKKMARNIYPVWLSLRSIQPIRLGCRTHAHWYTHISINDDQYRRRRLDFALRVIEFKPWTYNAFDYNLLIYYSMQIKLIIFSHSYNNY